MSLNLQLTFDTMLNHLRKQGKPAKAVGGLGCRYRNIDGLKCAVGCLLSDYHPTIEGLGATHREVFKRVDPKFGAANTALDWEFLGDAQDLLHDGIVTEPNFLEALERKAKRFAYKYNLEYKPCK